MLVVRHAVELQDGDLSMARLLHARLKSAKVQSGRASPPKESAADDPRPVQTQTRARLRMAVPARRRAGRTNAQPLQNRKRAGSIALLGRRN